MPNPFWLKPDGDASRESRPIRLNYVALQIG
jgi:hypothetical protein